MQDTLPPTLYTNYIDDLAKRGMKYSVKQFRADFPDDDTCLAVFFQERYGHIKACPRCGVINAKFYRVRGRKCYACVHCRSHIYPLADIIFHRSRTPLTDWLYAIYLFSVSKNGVAAKELERHLGITYKTAHRIGHQVRRIMTLSGKIGGHGIIVQADETYFGGRRRRSFGPRNKAAVLGIVEHGGEVRAKVYDTSSTRRAKEFLQANMKFDSKLYTDESRIYLWTDKYGIEHESVNHSQHEYARDNVTTNEIEGVWSQIKRSVDGTFHSVSRQYLQQYVDEFTWRLSHRRKVMFPMLLKRAAVRVVQAD